MVVINQLALILNEYIKANKAYQGILSDLKYLFPSYIFSSLLLRLHYT